MKKIQKVLLITVVLFATCAFLSAPSASSVTLNTRLVKADFDAVYYVIDFDYGSQRYVYPQDKYFFTWHEDFSEVEQISNEELAEIPLYNNILVRPGTKLVKIQSIPTVYAVSRDGNLYSIASEQAAEQMFGNNWADRVMDVQDSFWFNYTDMSIFENVDPLDGTWYPDGFLLKTAESDDIYLIWDNQKLLFDSTAAFEANGFNEEYICTTTQDILDSYDDGQVISEAIAWLIDDSQGPAVVPPSL